MRYVVLSAFIAVPPAADAWIGTWAGLLCLAPLCVYALAAVWELGRT